nr:MAG TPA: hypothetical protein [Caudoviricetes sp.]
MYRASSFLAVLQVRYRTVRSNHVFRQTFVWKDLSSYQTQQGLIRQTVNFIYGLTMLRGAFTMMNRQKISHWVWIVAVRVRLPLQGRRII